MENRVDALRRRDELGELARKAWSHAVADVFGRVPPSWVAPWDHVSEEWKEVNRRVADAVALRVRQEVAKETLDQVAKQNTLQVIGVLEWAINLSPEKREGRETKFPELQSSMPPSSFSGEENERNGK